MGKARTAIKEWGEAFLPWFTIIAGSLAGIWAYYNFSITATSEWDPRISVSAKVLPYNSKTNLLIIHVRPQNIGKVPIFMYGKNQGDISLTIEKMPTDHKPGQIKDDELKAVNEVKSLVKENNGEYDLMPNVKYDDVQYFVVRKPHHKSRYYAITAELIWPYPKGTKEKDQYSVFGETIVRLDPTKDNP